MFESAVAKTVAILAALLILAITATIGTKSGVGLAVLAFIFMIPGYLLSVFDINCTAVGECHIWSWIKTVFAVLSYVMLLTIAVTASVAAKKTAAEPAAAAATTTTPPPAPVATRTTTTTAPATTTTTA
jgi:hypothetical protein